MKKDWDDQPDEVAGSVGLANISTQKGSLVIYRGTACHYVTVGNLFASQTVKVETADQVLVLLGIMFDDWRGASPITSLPTWATLLHNSEVRAS